jgi:hypothetical protein
MGKISYKVDVAYTAKPAEIIENRFFETYLREKTLSITNKKFSVGNTRGCYNTTF